MINNDSLDGYTAGYFGELLEDTASDAFKDAYNKGKREKLKYDLQSWAKAYTSLRDEREKYKNK